MTLTDYMSATRFPRTTQTDPPLCPSGQLFLDAANWDNLQEWIEDGGKMSPQQVVIHAELKEKMPHNKRLAAEVGEAEMRQAQQRELFEHPANQLALKLLAQKKIPADPRVMGLVASRRGLIQ